MKELAMRNSVRSILVAVCAIAVCIILVELLSSIVSVALVSREAMQRHLVWFPRGMFSGLVEGRLDALEEREFQQACKSGTVRALKRFIQDHPHGRKLREAVSALKQLQDYFLEAEKAILETRRVLTRDLTVLQSIRKSSTDAWNRYSQASFTASMGQGFQQIGMMEDALFRHSIPAPPLMAESEAVIENERLVGTVSHWCGDASEILARFSPAHQPRWQLLNRLHELGGIKEGLLLRLEIARRAIRAGGGKPTSKKDDEGSLMILLDAWIEVKREAAKAEARALQAKALQDQAGEPANLSLLVHSAETLRRDAKRLEEDVNRFIRAN